jgi:uncharacterized protein YceH (UPF0502 family)
MKCRRWPLVAANGSEFAMSDSLPRILPLTEFADRIGASKRKARRLLHSPDGPVVTRIGRMPGVRDDHYRDWLDRLATSGAEHRQPEEAAA